MTEKKISYQTENNFNIIEPPKRLKNAIFRRISEEAKKRLDRRKMIFKTGIFLSFAFLVILGFIFGKEIIASDFWSLALLGFTDKSIVAAHWQEFILSLSETFPAEAVAFIFAPMFILLVLAKQYYSPCEYTDNIRIYKYTNMQNNCK
jgi:hypothetical protein